MLKIRKATLKDSSLILQFIRELATFEKLLHQVTATKRDIRRTLFGPRAAAQCLIGLWQENGKSVPIALGIYFLNYSTFLGRPGIYFEDLYVKPDFRSRGVGRAFFKHLAKLAVTKKYGRLDWAVLDWNSKAIQVYDSLGGRPLKDWIIYRLEGKTLFNLAK